MKNYSHAKMYPSTLLRNMQNSPLNSKTNFPTIKIKIASTPCP